MGMTGGGMSAAIKSGIESIPGIVVSDDAELTNWCDAVGDAIVNYIEANAVVNTNVTGTVTTGAGAGGAVVGTGVGTVS